MDGERKSQEQWGLKDISEWTTSKDVPACPYKHYKPEQHKEVVLKIIEIETNFFLLDMTLGFYESLDVEVSDALIEKRQFEIVLRHLNSFKDADLEIIGMLAINQGKFDLVLRYLNKFVPNGDNRLATALVCEIIKQHSGYEILEHREKHVFELIDHDLFVEQMISLSEQYVNHLSCFAPYLKNLSREIALSLINTQNPNVVGWMMVAMIDCFVVLDSEVAFVLIEQGGTLSASRLLDKFIDLDQKVANRLAESGYGLVIFQKAELFMDINLQEVIYKMASAKSSVEDIFHVSIYPAGKKAIQQIDFVILSDRMIEHGNEQVLAEHVDRFPVELHKTIALKLISENSGVLIMRFLQKFSGLDAEVVQALIDAGFGKGLAEEFEEWKKIDSNLLSKLRNDPTVNYIDRNPPWQK